MFASQGTGDDEDKEPLTFDELSMHQSKHFLDSLQELKNLRPQLYNAAEYCEYFFLNIEEKHMMVESLKDYTKKALVNAVDHLGSVTYKLDDLLNQQIEEISSTELRISCLSQRIRTCQKYNDQEGIMQQCLPERIPRFHKHYAMPGGPSLDDVQAKGGKTYIEIASESRRNENKKFSFRDEFQFSPSTKKPQSFFFQGIYMTEFNQDTEVPIPSTSPQSSNVQLPQLSPRLASSTSFAFGRRMSTKLSKSVSMRLTSDDYSPPDTAKATTKPKSIFKYLLNKHKSMKYHSNH